MDEKVVPPVKAIFDLRQFALLCAALALASCAAEPYRARSPAPVAPAPSTRVRPTQAPVAPAAAPVAPVAAVASLVAAANQMYAAGQYAKAASALERALRISPRDGALWHELARVRLAEGDLAQAAELAARSDALAAGDADLNWRNGEILRAARSP